MLRILHLEDDPVDAEMVLDLLRNDGFEVESDRVETMEQFRRELVTGNHGLILSDFSIPGLDAVEALGVARQLRPDLPFIFISGTIGEERAIETLKLGASDYVLKQRISRLVLSIRRALREAQDQALRKEAEAGLRESESRLHAIVSSAMDAVITIDSQQRIVLFNPAAVKIFGVSEADALGQHINRFIPERFREAHIQHVQRFGDSGATRRRMGEAEPLNGLRANGEEFPIEASISQTEVGGRRLYTVILRDITERKRAEAALSEARNNLERTVAERTAQLVEANTNLQTFAYTAAHDLRSPLRAIKGFSHMALEESAGQLNPDGQLYLNRVVSAADQMEHLLNDLLEYSKMSQAEMHLANVELKEAVIEALRLQEPEIRSRNAVAEVGELNFQVRGHAATVILVITNFLSNALKFMAPNVQPRVRIWAEDLHPFVRLTVQDNGIGISPENLGKLFGVFQRLHGQRAYPGTGLGLAIVRKGAERMGGRVGVESELRKGSRFWIELPKPSNDE